MTDSLHGLMVMRLAASTCPLEMCLILAHPSPALGEPIPGSFNTVSNLSDFLVAGNNHVLGH